MAGSTRAPASERAWRACAVCPWSRLAAPGSHTPMKEMDSRYQHVSENTPSNEENHRRWQIAPPRSCRRRTIGVENHEP